MEGGSDGGRIRRWGACPKSQSGCAGRSNTGGVLDGSEGERGVGRGKGEVVVCVWGGKASSSSEKV